MSFTLFPIGHVRGGRTEAVDDDWGASRAAIVLDPGRFTPDALAGLSDFSHAEVIFVFDQVPAEKIETGARHPRGRTDWPLVGIFAQRGKNRPNRLGLTTCRIVGVEGLTVEVEGLDAIDGSPVLDIKPVMREFLPRDTIDQPEWSHALMADYWAKPG
ncbi:MULTISPECIES: SAM-dependent methyltransferase [unclassified Sphingopyxis]|uniref:SAM-dependent methyltransferase n=1 Tax=unclassified Sphingopyxis TaxID=2614943 RepID=UPI000736C87A|nr:MULTISPECIES: SAM-dependent methyltransferase [unclassified Sphingopyxis]KTE31412.1 tRNA-Thr(GGU) m(6)t(6)A37 methyltransferase TsaA [Sphingopyxis sp. HIX]KTE81449.1 tRNA-Thr(GGU) m(6)t(6)A37 methyltransferase TsaA [Sphingopyxis sp. HXXIV]